ncbi:MAG: tellurite resistance/C4-dicarboxylate transporter family protein [Oleiphilaceae bacterium]|nr:tellurite resistance/C4-dicarboxylate transporter family protein [Oleiphilaceae bacterium]
MLRFLPKISALLDEGAAQLFPGYFAVVMATGATSIASHLLGYELIARLLLVANVLAYIALWLLTIIRLVRYPRRLMADMADHARAPGFFTLVAGTCILGSQFQVLLEWRQIAFGIWLLGTGLWVLLMYAFFMVVTTRHHKPDLAKGINGAWLLVAVSTQSVAILATLTDGSNEDSELQLFFALCMYLVGCMLYLAIIPLIFYRLTFLKLTVESLTPPYWINMGAAAITTLAGATLIARAPESSLLTSFIPFLTGFTVFFWAIASWWIPLLLGLTAWRHLFQRHRLAYDPQLWSMVFPIAMYTTGSVKLADAMELFFLMPVPMATVWLAWLAWLLTSLGMWWHFVRRLDDDSGH